MNDDLRLQQLAMGHQHPQFLTRRRERLKPYMVAPHPGCCEVAPLLPHFVQRAHCRSRSLDVSAPHRIISGTRAMGAWCKHFSQWTQVQQWLGAIVAGWDLAKALSRLLRTSWRARALKMRAFTLIQKEAA
jgi:hypothetical protein